MKALLFTLTTAFALTAFGHTPALVESALKESIVPYYYSDEGKSCGGELLSYKVASESDADVVVEAEFSASTLHRCDKATTLNCVGTYKTTGVKYEEVTFVCH